MDEETGVGREYRRASPWPLFVALGFVIGELGIFLGILAFAVSGVVLFGGSVAGILSEAGYARRPWRLLSVVGVLFVVLGAALWAIRVPDPTLGSALADLSTDLVARRGAAVLGGGAILVVAGVVGAVWAPGDYLR